MITDTQLFALNEQGFIPGPGETEDAFLSRVAAAESFFSHPPNEFKGVEMVSDPQWDWARHYLKNLYDLRPKSLFAFYENRKLAPWQGAASWIFETDAGPLCAVQLKKGFVKGSFLGGLYSRDEILAHEAVHAARAAFNEPINEEFFAYFTAKAKWRRVLGPIIRRPWEALFFLLALAVGSFFGQFLPAAFLLSFAFIRLGLQHRKIAKASQTLSKKVSDSKKLRSILLRLTDREINTLSRGIDLTDDGSLRWRIIRLYFE